MTDAEKVAQVRAAMDGSFVALPRQVVSPGDAVEVPIEGTVAIVHTLEHGIVIGAELNETRTWVQRFAWEGE